MLTPAIDTGSEPVERTIGEAALIRLDFYTSRDWIWIGIIYQCGYAAFMTLACAVILQFQRNEKHHAVVEDEQEAEKMAKVSLATMTTLREIYSDIEQESGGFSIEARLPFERITLVFRNIRYVRLVQK